MRSAFEISESLEKMIGSGAQANVYLHKNGKGSTMALKEFNDEMTRDCELTALIRLHGLPHVMQMMVDEDYEGLEEGKDTNECSGDGKSGSSSPRNLSIPLKFCCNGELSKVISHHKCLPEAACKHLFRQLLVALLSCHSHGVIHRDIKPDNIMFDEECNVVLGDFGLSDNLNEEDFNTAVGGDEVCGFKGSLSYLAPEVRKCADEGSVSSQFPGRAADVWSAGCVLFVMLTGNFPFGDMSSSDWYFLQMKYNRMSSFWSKHGSLSVSGPVSEGAQVFLNRIFKFKPKDRAPVADLLIDPWLCDKPESIHRWVTVVQADTSTSTTTTTTASVKEGTETRVDEETSF